MRKPRAVARGFVTYDSSPRSEFIIHLEARNVGLEARAVDIEVTVRSGAADASKSGGCEVGRFELDIEVFQPNGPILRKHPFRSGAGGPSHRVLTICAGYQLAGDWKVLRPCPLNGAIGHTASAV